MEANTIPPHKDSYYRCYLPQKHVDTIVNHIKKGIQRDTKVTIEMFGRSPDISFYPKGHKPLKGEQALYEGFRIFAQGELNE